MYVESRFREDARSPKGALGLMQVMPATGARYGAGTPAELMDPRTNIDVGVRHLRELMDRFPGRLDLALAAYNAGEDAVLRHGWRLPPYAETQRYVEQVIALLDAADEEHVANAFR
jgi:soluble lytic murein transglycosylase-like protein